MLIDAREKFASRTADYIASLDKAEATKRFSLFNKEHIELILKIVKRKRGITST